MDGLNKDVEITELYGGKVVIKFYPKSHQYWVSVKGSPFERKTGVTTIIGIKDKSKALGVWQQQITADYLLSLIEAGKKVGIDTVLEAVIQCDLKRDEAADIGKEIHDWCEHYIKHKLKLPGYKELPEMPNFPEAITGINSFFEWEKAHKVKYISSERPVYSIKHDFIGTMDLEAEIDGKYCLNDFKSSNGLYNGVRLQTSAYAHADMEERGTKVKKYQGRWAIRFSKYTEEEYYKKEERKKELKKAIARIQNKEFKDYNIKPYQVFETKFLDCEKGFMKRDFEAFLNFKAGFEWDKQTDPFYNGDSW